MRINVYAEELTHETELVVKVADGHGGKREFYGVRMFLESPDTLHHAADDDDRSAITLWVPWTLEGGYDIDAVRDVLEQLHRRLTILEGDLRNAHVKVRE